jgi:hypothetical protein
MAKKRKGGKAGRSKVKKAARKPAKKAVKKVVKKRGPAGPMPVKTGRGPGPAEIGADVVRMIRAQAGDAAIWAKWWSPRCESIEGGGANMVWKGMKEIRGKSEWWAQDHAMRGCSVEGPFVGATGFAVHFKAEIETRSTGVVETMTEVGVYTVQNGKVVREEFMGLETAPAAAVEAKPDVGEQLAAKI